MGRWIERGLLFVALPCLGWPAVVRLDAELYQASQGQRLDHLVSLGADRDRRSTAADAIDAGTGPGDDRLVGRIEVPRLGLSAIVAEGVDTRTLRRAVGHHPGTALPGGPGNTVLAGHRDTFFRALRDVSPGDLVRITTPRGTFDYNVEELSVVPPDRVDLLSPSATPTLTLITCYPFHYIGPAPQRFIVRARPALDFRPIADS